MRLRFQCVLPSLAAGLILVPGALAMHAHLTASFPAKGEVLAQAPGVVRLTFSEKTEVAVSDVKVLGADSSAIPVGKVVRGDDSLTITAPILGEVGPGEYAVIWRTAGRDGHPIRGRYTFRVTPPPAPAETARSSQAESGDPARR